MKPIFFIIIVLTILQYVNVVDAMNNKEIQYTTHPIIELVGNGDFVLEGFPGNGTELEPYLIENYILNAHGGEYGIKITGTTMHFIIRDCIITNATSSIIAPNGVGIHLDTVSNGSIINNTISKCTYSGIYIHDSIDLKIQKNKINNITETSFGEGINLIRTDNCIITNNTIKNNMKGIEIFNSANNNISENIIMDISYNGIMITYDSSLNEITSNDISLCDKGITIEGTSTMAPHLNNFTSNKISNSNTGIYLIGANNNTINNNNISNNNFDGIHLTLRSNNNTIAENMIVDNPQYGIKISIFAMYYSIHNRIHHNNFILNGGGTNQVLDECGYNYWNTTVEGNYWSDWITPDIAPADGIVDIPYDISGGAGAADYYPLTDPVDIASELQKPPVWPIFIQGILLIAFLARKRL